MKKSFLSIFLIPFFFNLNAQTDKSIGPFTIKKVDLLVGIDSDRIKNYDPNIITNQLKDEPNFHIDQANFTDLDMVSRNNSIPHLRFGLTLEIPKYQKLEWRNSINWIPNRIFQIKYITHDLEEFVETFGTTLGYEFTGFNLGQFQSEIGLESAILRKFVDKKTIKIYGGFGSNAGLTYNNHVRALGSNIGEISEVTLKNEEEFNAYLENDSFYYYSNDDIKLKSQFNHRLFAQVGASAVIKEKVEIGLDLRRGIGYSLTKGESTEFLHLLSSSLSARLFI